MKQVVLLPLLFISIGTTLLAQRSEYLIPKEAVTVFSLNNISLLQKISMDDLITYDFMEEVHQELFDGSTNGKSLKDAGIDFGQRLNVFYGKSNDYEISGFTLGVSDEKQLFEVFDDFEQLQSKYKDVSIYGSFFNNLILHEKSAILIRVEPSMELIDKQTDSIWYARGNGNPYGDDFYYNEGILTEDIYLEEDSTIQESDVFPEASDDPNEKNYYELRDSVQITLQNKLLEAILDDLFIKHLNLTTEDQRFTEQMSHTSEGTFYLDNSRNFEQAKGLWYFQTVLPSLYQDIRELYTGNVILGDWFLKDNTIEFAVEARYGQKLGSIYEEMNDSKFDKNIIPYINKDNSAFFTYNVNMRQAYEKAYEVIMPILSSEKNSDIAMNVLTIELLNEFINKDALFETYKGSMFGTFNGVKKINTKKIEYYYDDETFEYGEKETEATEDMPIFTLGFSIDRKDIPELILKHLSKLTSLFEQHEDYWKFNNAILDAAPLFMISRNGLFILTNDEDLAINHIDGYGKDALSKKTARSLKHNGFMNGFIDISGTLNRFPSDLLNQRQSDMVNALKGKSGKLYLKSTKTSKANTNFLLTYSFLGDDKSGKHMLELINTLYIFSK